MRAVKCPVSDATASTAASQGQLEEELLIYGQCCCNSSTTCRQVSAFHLQTTGSYFPYPITGLSPPSPPPTWCFCKFFCLFVCLFFSVSMLAGSFSALPLPHTETHKYSFPLSLFSLSYINTSKHTYALTRILVFSNSPSSDID